MIDLREAETRLRALEDRAAQLERNQAFVPLRGSSGGGGGKGLREVNTLPEPSNDFDAVWWRDDTENDDGTSDFGQRWEWNRRLTKWVAMHVFTEKEGNVGD